MRVISKISLLGAALVIAVVLSIQLSLQESTATKLLPSDFLSEVRAEYEVKELPLGQTESIEKRISSVLQFSDYRYWQLTRGKRTYNVYIAYWSSGQTHILDSSTHAPDNCWIAAGWKKTSKAQTLTGGSETEAEIIESLRTFQAPNGQEISCIFSHFVGLETLTYQSYGTGKTIGFLKDNLALLFRGKKPQAFVRISSSLDIAELADEPLVEEILNAVRATLELET